MFLRKTVNIIMLFNTSYAVIRIRGISVFVSLKIILLFLHNVNVLIHLCMSMCEVRTLKLLLVTNGMKLGSQLSKMAKKRS